MTKPTTIEEVLTNLARNASVRNTVRTDIDEALATIEQLVLDAAPGTAVIDMEDFKSKEEESEWVGYCRAVEHYQQALKQILGGKE